MNKLISGVALAVGAAAMFSVAPAFADDTTTTAAPMVACKGVNTCKGTGSCKTAANTCKGQNACKGQGVSQMSQDDCTKAGGTVDAAPAAPAQ